MKKRERFSPALCRAARGLLGWPQERLAERAHLDLETVARYEAGAGALSPGETVVLGLTFNTAGVVAIAPPWAGPGVCFSKPEQGLARTRFVSAPTDGPRPGAVLAAFGGVRS